VNPNWPTTPITLNRIRPTWYVHPRVVVNPNLERVRYANDRDPAQFPGRHQDSILRCTFFWTF